MFCKIVLLNVHVIKNVDIYFENNVFEIWNTIQNIPKFQEAIIPKPLS